jgi:hypothetical protein
MAAISRKRAIAQNIVADCPAGIVVKNVVYISADEVGGVYQVDLVNINSSTTYPALGVVIRKLTTTRCVVQVGGELVGIYSGLTPGRQLFVDASSELTHVVPSRPPTGVRLVYPMAVALSGDALLLRALSPVRLVA